MKAPIIMLIILIFVAIFLYGSLLEPYTGEGIYYARVQAKDDIHWFDTVLKFDPVEGGRQIFHVYNIVYEGSEEDAPIVSMDKTTLSYTGNYFKHVFGPLYLRPTGLHFPVVDFEGANRFILNWEPLEAVALDGNGELIADYEYSTTPHRSTMLITDDGMNFENLPCKKVDEIPAKLMELIETLDAAEPGFVREAD